MSSNLLTPKNRNAADKERGFKEANQTLLNNTFSVIIYCNLTTEEVPLEHPVVVRARSLAGHHDHTLDPSKMQSTNDARKEILKMFMATLDPTSEHIGALVNGSIWKAYKTSENTVSLISPESGGSSIYKDNPALPPNAAFGGARDAFSKGRKKPVLTAIRQSGGKIGVIYSSKTSMEAQVKQYPFYRVFIDEFIKRLEATPYTGDSIKVNSMYRSPYSQASAMVRTRFIAGSSKYTLQYFRGWYGRTYSKKSKSYKPVKAIVDQSWTDPMKLREALEKEFTRQQADGTYVSPHMQHGAFDLNTTRQPYQNVIYMLEVLAAMKSSGFVNNYNWEGVWDYSNVRAENPNKGLNIRKTQGTISNEHIHLSINKNAKAGE